MNICTILGTRPQFIKASLLSRKLRYYHNETIIHTGQHYDDTLSEVFFDELELPKPKINLEVGSDLQCKQIGKMLIKIEEVLLQEEPDVVLVYGDTNSTLAGALAASKLGIPIIHIEAGLRSYNKKMSEEQNRVITDHLSTILFAPTENAVKNLKKEGITEGVFFVGDVMYDSILYYKDHVNKEASNLLNKYRIEGEYVLATIHRAENTDYYDNLKNIVEAFNEYKGLIVLPLHPRTRKSLNDYKLEFNKNVKIIEPVGYLEMLILEIHSKKIITDSGGVQKEAFFLKKPCITLRKETEWIETVIDGWNILVGTDKNKILAALYSFEPQGEQRNYFGDGNATDKIVKIINESEDVLLNYRLNI